MYQIPSDTYLEDWKCPICGSVCKRFIDNECRTINCDICGTFKLDNGIKQQFLFDARKINLECQTTNKDDFDRETSRLVYLVQKKCMGTNEIPILTNEYLGQKIRYPLSLSGQIEQYIWWTGRYLKYPHDEDREICLNDYSYAYFGCENATNLEYLSQVLEKEGLTTKELFNFTTFVASMIFVLKPSLSKKGWDVFEALNKKQLDSHQAFVAMWFSNEEDRENHKPNMYDVYDKAISPAIEADGRFSSRVLYQVEHINDINDEMIAQIRRSRFIVADLTGYRGGVYWEAGFAYGLGLPVIYTCHEDWQRQVKRNDGTIEREGIHFDLEHRNIIFWNQDNLPAFKEKLANRIAAIIV